MTIPAIGSLSTPLLDGVGSGGSAGADAAGGAGKSTAGGFANIIKDQLSKLDESQAAADTTAQDIAANRVDDVAQAMLTVEKANVQLQYATQLRNKAIEAYQDILRMQM